MKTEYTFYRVWDIFSDRAFFFAENNNKENEVFSIAWRKRDIEDTKKLLKNESDIVLLDKGNEYRIKRFENGLYGIQKKGRETFELIESLIKTFSGSFGIMFHFPTTLREAKKRKLPFSICCMTKADVVSINNTVNE